MNNSTHPLHVWIFNDASVASLLRADSPLWADFVPGVIVEIAERPTLAHALDLETPPSYPGVAGLLGTAAAPSDLVVRLPAVSIPAILTAAQPLTPATLSAALRKLANDGRIFGPRVILLDAALVPALTSALLSCTKLGIAWDLSIAPGPALPALLGTLATENLLRPETWAGLNAYFSPDHFATDEEHSAALASLNALPTARLLPSLAAS